VPTLQQKQQAVLRQFRAAPLTADQASRGAGLPAGLGRGIVVELARWGLLTGSGDTAQPTCRLTDRGREVAGRRLLRRAGEAILSSGAADHAKIAEYAGLAPAQFRFVLGLLRATRAVEIGRGGVLSLTGEWSLADAIDGLLDRLAEVDALPVDRLPAEHRRVLASGPQRGAIGTLIEVATIPTSRYALTDRGRGVLAEVGHAGGREVRFYDFQRPPPRPARSGHHPLARAVRLTRRLLTRLGYQDVNLSCTTLELSAMDMMFIPAFHPARDTRHSLYLAARNVAAGDPWSVESVERTRRVHRGGELSRGWGCEPPLETASRAMLLPHVISGLVEFARTDAHRSDRLYATARCFRWDKPDRWHRPDFLLTEGLVLAGDGSVAALVGLFEELAAALFGNGEVLVFPAYHPFTEPSVEIHVPGADGGAFELGGGGRIRPEVCAMAGLAEGCAGWWLNTPGLVVEALGLDSVAALYGPASTLTGGTVAVLERAGTPQPPDRG
jgi:phenylalanyl-tRNA synthetase alpha chain